MKRERVPPLLVLLMGFVFLVHAQLTPRPVTYSLKELEIYNGTVDSLRAEVHQRDSLITFLKANLHVSEYNNKAVVAQLDIIMMEDK